MLCVRVSASRRLFRSHWLSTTFTLLGSFPWPNCYCDAPTALLRLLLGFLQGFPCDELHRISHTLTVGASAANVVLELEPAGQRIAKVMRFFGSEHDGHKLLRGSPQK